MIKNEYINGCVAKCCEILDLSNGKLDDEYFYSSLPFCVLDAVYSIGSHYNSTKKVVERYADSLGLKRYTFENPDKICTIQDFLSDIGRVNNAKHFACEVLRNRQRTSPRYGILKAEACYLVAEVLQKNGIDNIQDFRNMSAELRKKVEEEIKRVPGQGSGIMLRYLTMLSGDDNTCKPDRHIRAFIKPIVGETINDDEIQELLFEVNNLLKADHPHLCVRLLDNLIWNYQRTQ